MSAVDFCAVCEEPIAGKPWLLLNRWVIGTGSARAMVEAWNADGDYLWEMAEDAQEEFATGRVLHWPICATQWIEAKMSEADVELRRRSR